MSQLTLQAHFVHISTDATLHSSSGLYTLPPNSHLPLVTSRIAGLLLAARHGSVSWEQRGQQSPGRRTVGEHVKVGHSKREQSVSPFCQNMEDRD